MKTSLFLIALIFSVPSYSSSNDSNEKIETRIFKTQEDKLHDYCSSLATEYCGKTTKSLQITEEEFSCLYKLSTRVTRQIIPGYDNSKCDRLIKETKFLMQNEKSGDKSCTDN